jgi:hypothetical protein
MSRPSPAQRQARSEILEHRRLLAAGDRAGAAAAFQRARRAVWKLPIGHDYTAVLSNTPVSEADLFDELREAVTAARNGQPYDRARIRAVSALLAATL